MRKLVIREKLRRALPVAGAAIELEPGTQSLAMSVTLTLGEISLLLVALDLMQAASAAQFAMGNAEVER